LKNVYRVSTEHHGDIKSGILRSKNATILQARTRVNAIALHVFVWLQL